MGKGTSISESFNYKGPGLSFIQNFDGNNHFLGVGLGLDLKASGAIKLTKAKVRNGGIIISAQEFEQLNKLSFKEADFTKQVFEIRKVDKNNIGMLYVFNIPTNIAVVDKSDYFISVNIEDLY